MLAPPGITEVLIVGNAPTEVSFADETEAHPCVVRLNKGANPLVLEKTKAITGARTHIHCISGYGGGDFGPLAEFAERKILWSRPTHDGPNKYGLFVYANVFKAISQVTSDQTYITRNYFDEINQRYGLGNPTTGTIAVYYFKRLGFAVKLVNFPLKKNLPNMHARGGSSAHDIQKERDALRHLLGVEFE